MKKKIGLVASIQSDKLFGIGKKYFAYFAQFGDVVLLNGLSDTFIPGLDLLVLPGGADLNPARYNEFPHVMCNKPNIALETFDTEMLSKYLEAGVKVFGICRGMQTGNVYYGGKLQQHMHVHHSTKWRGELVDELKFINQEVIPFAIPRPLLDLADAHLKEGKFYEVNSIHHQGVPGELIEEGNQRTYVIDPYYACDEFIPIAFDTNFHNVEAFISRDQNYIAVQWHPEELQGDWFSEKCIKYLLNKEN